jgi:FkbM family methyltransferase
MMRKQNLLQDFLDGTEQSVAADALLSIAKVKSHVSGKGLFIDCGSNLGQGFEYFRRFFPLELYDYILIEPNPNCIPYLKRTCESLVGNIKIVDQAASTQEGHVKFFGLSEGNADPTSQGGSIVRGHNSRYYAADETRAITVKTFSLRQLVESQAANYASIILKLDIEGGEYKVLEDVIFHGTHLKLDFSYIEFHSQYMAEPESSEYRAKEIAFEQRFTHDLVPFRRWI